MDQITSRVEKMTSRSSAKGPSGGGGGGGGGLQYFTYDDVAASAMPTVGDFPQHGDTVALGEAEQEAELARSRASKRISQALEGREHEDIFANAPEEPLAPEEPSRRSRRGSGRGSRRSSRRISRKSSLDGGLMPSTSRDSRAISPEREDLNGTGGERSRRDSTSRRITRRTSDAMVDGMERPIAPASPEPVAEPAAVTRIKSGTPGTPATADPSPSPRHGASHHPLSQVPTADDMLSRTQTRQSSGITSRQSTRGADLDKRTSTMTTGSTKSKSKRQSRRPSKPEPLKYFTYDDVVSANPPVFGQVPDTELLKDRNSRVLKGKEREPGHETDGGELGEDEPAPQVPELPQKLAHMDFADTGLTRSSTRGTAGAKTPRRDRASVPVAAGSPPLAAANAGRGPVRASAPVGQGQDLAAVHGLDFTDIPTTRRNPAPPPPVNMSNKPSRDFKSSVPGVASVAAAATAATAAVGAGVAAITGRGANRNGDAQPAKAPRTSSFQEQLPEALRHGGTQEGRVNGQKLTNGDSQPVLERTRQAMGQQTTPAVTPGLTPGVGNEAGFVSAPSSPFVEKGPFVPPAAGVIAGSGNANNVSSGAGAAPPAKTVAQRQVREERLTREVHTYDVNNPDTPIVTLEVLSKRFFMQLDDGRFVEVVEKDIPAPVINASKLQRPEGPLSVPSHEFLSSQNI